MMDVISLDDSAGRDKEGGSVAVEPKSSPLSLTSASCRSVEML